MSFNKRDPHDLLRTLNYQVVDACNKIMDIERVSMADRRAALDSALSFITARRDQCWPQNDPPGTEPHPSLVFAEPAADPDEDLL